MSEIEGVTLRQLIDLIKLILIAITVLARVGLVHIQMENYILVVRRGAISIMFLRSLSAMELIKIFYMKPIRT